MRWLLDATKKGVFACREDVGDERPGAGDALSPSDGDGVARWRTPLLDSWVVGLTSTPPTATVKAAYSKRRRENSVPLRDDTSEALKPFVESRPSNKSVFNMSGTDSVVKYLLGPDLERARDAWIADVGTDEARRGRAEADFLRYEDCEGRFADFHSPRHSFVSHLGRNTDFKTAQDLARHRAPSLTARHVHGFRDDQIAAINSLPRPHGRGTVAATGPHESCHLLS